MLAYNITFSMEFSQVAFWEQWLMQKFLPMMLDSQLHSPKVFKVYTTATEQSIFTVQFLVNSFSEFDVFQKIHEAGVIKQVTKSFGNDVVCFTSFIQEIDIHV
jgi:hypothetical protein